jgi:putative hemolysin
MNKKLLVIIILIVFAIFYFFTGGKFKTSNIPGLDILDSASKNCTEKGGTIHVKQRGDGKEYKVCLFEDNRQCEAASLLAENCPVGGLKITGYITEAAVYCAILGGKYEITGMNDINEDGNCSFFNSKVCNVWDLYNGKCEKGEINAITYENEEFNFLLKLPNSWKDKYQIKREERGDGIRYISFDYGEPNLFKISIVPYSIWEKQDKKEGEYLGRNNADVFTFLYSSDPIRSDKQWGEEYLRMISSAESIKNTFKITKPYIFLERKTESGKNYDVEIMYPSVGAISNGQVNIEISDFVNGIANSFKEMVGKPDAWDGDNSLKIFYEPYEINNDFVSIRFEISEYIGGAHPNSYSKSFNYDLKNNKIIGLSDIFDSNKDYLNVISNKTIQYLLKVNNENGLTDEESIKQGAGPKIDNFKTFTFNKNTIVFYFDPNAVAVYVAGRQDVIFPLSSIKDILRSDAVVNYKLND